MTDPAMFESAFCRHNCSDLYHGVFVPDTAEVSAGMKRGKMHVTTLLPFYETPKIGDALVQ